MPTLLGTINNFDNGQTIFRRESVELLVARIRLLEDHIAAQQSVQANEDQLTLYEKAVKELKFGMNMPNAKDVAFCSLWVARRQNGDFTSTWMHLEEEDFSDELKAEIANILRNLSDSICPTTLLRRNE